MYVVDSPERHGVKSVCYYGAKSVGSVVLGLWLRVWGSRATLLLSNHHLFGARGLGVEDWRLGVGVMGLRSRVHATPHSSAPVDGCWG